MGIHAEYGINATCHKPLANALTHFILGERLALEEFLHQRVVVLRRGFDKGLVKFHRLVHLIGRNILTFRLAAIGTPREFFHDEHINDAVELRTGFHGILHLHAFGTIDFAHGVDNIIKVALVGIQLVDEEYNGFSKFLGIAEVVLRAHLGTVLAVDQNHGLIGHVERRDGSTNKIIRPRTVDNIQFLVVPLHMKHCREDRIAILELYGEIVAHRVLGPDRPATLDDTCLKKHTLGKSGLAATRTAKQCDVLNFVSLIYSHIKRFKVLVYDSVVSLRLGVLSPIRC